MTHLGALSALNHVAAMLRRYFLGFGRVSRGWHVVSCFLLCLAACSKAPDPRVGERGATPLAVAGGAGTWVIQPASAVAGATARPVASGTSAQSGVAGAGATMPAASGGGAEICDGKDNDANGIIDDVDMQGDGVCDCLNIATIGEIGPWSNGGNVFKSWLNSRSPTPAVELGDAILSDDLLKPYQVIVILYAATIELNGTNGRKLAAHHAFSADEVAVLARWVQSGGGVMSTAGYYYDEAKEVENVNRLLAPFGMGYSTIKRDLGGSCTNWVAHPVTEQVMRINTMDGVEPEGVAGITLVHDEGQRVALQVTEVDAGHVIVFGDDWITYDSEWQMIQDQQVERFWLNMLKWLSPARVCQVPISPD